MPAALARGSGGALPLVGVCWGVTAGKSSHNASNVRDVTAGQMGRNSSVYIFNERGVDLYTCNLFRRPYIIGTNVFVHICMYLNI